MSNKLKLNLLFGLILSFMIFITIKTSLESNLFVELPSLWAIPWFKATIIDFYLNQLILYGLVLYLEKNFLRTVPWLILFFIFGSIGTALYGLYYFNWKKTSQEAPL
jgi:H+/Cl- antiporter ClcA